MSLRKLQRRLSDEGTTFQKQLNHTRKLLAKHYLSKTAMGSDEIACLLGYLELSSFLRTFSFWCGQSPSEWRRSHKDKQQIAAAAGYATGRMLHLSRLSYMR